jgi:hypothetical protein
MEASTGVSHRSEQRHPTPAVVQNDNSSGGLEMTKRPVVATIFLQAVIVLIGIGALCLMLWEPHIEGRNAHATLRQIYFNDPFLAYAYLSSIPFFLALYQAIKVLRYIRENNAFSQPTLNALRTVRFCGFAIVGFVALGELFIVLGDSDDRAGGVFIGLLIAFGSLVISAAATTFEGILQNALDQKSERDLQA